MTQQNPASPTPTATIDYDDDQGPSATPILVPGNVDFHELCATTDIEDGMGKPFSVDGNHLAVFRYEDGYYACDNRCPHMGYPLSEGSVRDGVLICHWHHWEFDLKTGGCFLTNGDDVASFPVDERDGVLFVEVLHGMNTDDPSYLVAFKAATGEVLWHRERATDAVGESPDAYTTPTLLEHDGQMQIVVSGGDYVTGHDPATGKELWRAGGLNPNKETNYRVAGSPVVADGMVYATSRRNPVLAFHAGGLGDISESHLAWKFEGAGGPDVPSATTDGRLFFMVDDRGRATCLDAKTGEKVWGPERLAQGSVSASPVLADGKLYVVNEDGVTTVLQAGPEFKVLATNELDGAYTLSSLAIAEGRIYLRTESHLYCIAQSEQE